MVNGGPRETWVGDLRYYRMSPALSVVADNDLKTTAKAETVAERVRKLQLEARTLAKDHVRALEQALTDVELLAAEIAEGGDAYPVGARELASRLVQDLPAKAETMKAILAKI